jgi:hypothetical protein
MKATLNLNVETKLTYNNIAVKACLFVELSDLVPSNWEDWFWSAISDSAPFSWGDNNRSLVCASDFKDHAENVISMFSSDYDEDVDAPTQHEIDDFINKLNDLGNTYIDLEN